MGGLAALSRRDPHLEPPRLPQARGEVARTARAGAAGTDEAALAAWPARGRARPCLDEETCPPARLAREEAPQFLGEAEGLDARMRGVVQDELMGETGQAISRNVQQLIRMELERLLRERGL